MRRIIVCHRNAVYLTVLILLSLGLWLPRLRGPLDLRYDAGVYYILGTSLAQGTGYRLLNEPGKIQAIQYPPLLPLLAAASQRLAGSDDPAIAGHWLRIFFFMIFLAFTVSVYCLSRRYLASGFAFLATLVMLLHTNTTWMSELFFAELPFALTSVLFLLLARQGAKRPREWLLGTLGAVSFLLRTAGIALLAAWVGDSLIRRRPRQIALRTTLALIPVLAWHGYIAHVKGGPEYAQPSYEYQRAGYQYYNVGYLENIAYVDPFVPELGMLTPQLLTKRIARNFLHLPASFGATVSVDPEFLRNGIARLNKHLGTLQSPLWIAQVPVVILGVLVILGLVLLGLRREWIIVLYLVGSAGLICLTPWPAQFIRYAWPLIPLLAPALFITLIEVRNRLSKGGLRHRSIVGIAFVTAVALLIFSVQLVALARKYRESAKASYKIKNGERQEYRLFFYTSAWQLHDGALDWLEGVAGHREIVATSTPQWAYLKTGLPAVMPPFEPDVREAQRLLDSVPVSYLVLDHLEFLDISRRYAAPIVKMLPERWELIYSSAERGSQIYRRVTSK